MRKSTGKKGLSQEIMKGPRDHTSLRRFAYRCRCLGRRSRGPRKFPMTALSGGGHTGGSIEKAQTQPNTHASTSAHARKRKFTRAKEHARTLWHTLTNTRAHECTHTHLEDSVDLGRRRSILPYLTRPAHALAPPSLQLSSPHTHISCIEIIESEM